MDIVGIFYFNQDTKNAPRFLQATTVQTFATEQTQNPSSLLIGMKTHGEFSRTRYLRTCPSLSFFSQPIAERSGREGFRSEMEKRILLSSVLTDC